MFADGRRQTCSIAVALKVSEDESFFVVKLAEYLVVTQIVAITDTKPDDSTSLTAY